MTQSKAGLAILNIGTELVEGQILNRNGFSLCGEIYRNDFEVLYQLTVGDDFSRIQKTLDFLNGENVEAIIVTGGLGPTRDDFTRKVLSTWSEAPLDFDSQNFAKVSGYLSSKGLPVLEMQKQQSYFPKGARIFDNKIGTADGFGYYDVKHNIYFLILPGPPQEITSVLDNGGRQWLFEKIKTRHQLLRWTFTTMGLGESAVADQLEGLLKGEPVEFGYRVHQPYVEAKLWINKKNVDRWPGIQAKVRESFKDLWSWEEDQDHVQELATKLTSFRSPLVWDISPGKSLYKRLADLSLPMEFSLSEDAAPLRSHWVQFKKYNNEKYAFAVYLNGRLKTGFLEAQTPFQKRHFEKWAAEVVLGQWLAHCNSYL